MNRFKHIDKILNNNPRVKQDKYVPKLLELIDGSVVLTVAGNELLLENLHFEEDVKIKIYNKSEINIKNCTFEGILIFSPQPEGVISGIDIFVFKTIVKNKINFNRVANYARAELDCCVTSSANFSDDNIDFVKIFKSEIDEVYFEGTTVKELSITHSFIKNIINYDLNARDIYIDIESILNNYKKFNEIKVSSFINDEYIKESKSKIKEYNNLIKSKKSLNPNKSFKEFKNDLINNINVEKKSIVDHKKIARSHYLKYIQTIKKSKDESIDDSVISELNYLYFKNKKYSPLIYLLLSSVGFFYKPSKAIFLSVLTILTFGIAFYSINHFGDRLLTLSEICTPSILNKVAGEFVDAIYMSGITFFTIGYPGNLGEAVSFVELIRKVLILIEAGMGIILISTILISFMNKYLSIKNKVS